MPRAGFKPEFSSDNLLEFDCNTLKQLLNLSATTAGLLQMLILLQILK